MVITIIILLILAGVSLSLIVGDDGILGRSMGSVSATRKAVAEEQVYLAWSSAQAVYYDEKVHDASVESSDYFQANKLTNYVSQGEIVDVKYKMNSEGESQVIYKDTTVKKPVYYTVIIKGNGEVVADSNATTTPPEITPSTPSEESSEELAKIQNANRNLFDAMEMIKTAECGMEEQDWAGGLSNVNEILQRMFELSVQSANSPESTNREEINKDMQALIDEINSISEITIYKNVTLLNGTISGENGWRAELAERTLKIAIEQLNSSTLGLNSIDVLTQSGAVDACDIVEQAIMIISNVRSKLGARQNELDHISTYYTKVESALTSGVADNTIKIKIASAGIEEIYSCLNRMDELNNMALNEGADRQSLLNEALLLKEAINIIAEDSQYKGQKLLDGSYNDIPNLNCVGLGENGLELYVEYMTPADITRTQTEVKNAIAKVEAVRQK